MIKFFRSIRYRLIHNGKTTKYLTYAVGEIFLVVVGILIALSINNWNENRKERAKELKYLRNLRTDLQNEISNSEQFATFHFTRADHCATLLYSKAPSTIEEVQDYTDTYEAVFIWKAFVPTNNTFKELISSGNLSLLKNDSIKNGLLELDKLYANIALGEHHMRREYEEYLYDVNIHNITALAFFDLTTPTYGFPKRLRYKDIPSSEHSKLIADAQLQHNNKLFKNGLRLAMMNNSFIAGMHKELIEYIQNLIKIITTELEA
ncbi:MAG: DUF6090 family protein [Flavobacteriales bacterium]|nr:DUF6090 family protein [Flavobacteriales bacterium]